MSLVVVVYLHELGGSFFICLNWIHFLSHSLFCTAQQSSAIVVLIAICQVCCRNIQNVGRRDLHKLSARFPNVAGSSAIGKTLVAKLYETPAHNRDIPNILVRLVSMNAGATDIKQALTGKRYETVVA